MSLGEAFLKKYGDTSKQKKAEKELKKAEKKAKYGNENLPVIEMRIPLEIDLEKPPWDSYIKALEENWRHARYIHAINNCRPIPDPKEKVRYKIIRT